MGFNPAPFSSRAAVVCRGTGKTWAPETPRAHEALRAIDLEIDPGEFVVLLGPSGCGKSTLLYLIAGLEEPTTGELWSFGDRVSAPSPDRSLIFQETSLFPWLSVGQNVAFGLSVRGDGKATRQTIAREALSRVGLAEAADKRPDELSGGMRQRVAVARALAMRPKVLLMDEPFAALDVQTRSKMQDFLLDVWRVSGASVLFVTHHIDEAHRAGRPRRRVHLAPGADQDHRHRRHRSPARPVQPGRGCAAPAADRPVAGRGRPRFRRAGSTSRLIPPESRIWPPR